MNVLVLNSGSSSLKFQIIATDLEQIKSYTDDRICRGELEGIGGEAIIRVQHRNDPGRTMTAPLRDTGFALDYLVRYIASDQSGITEIKSTADVHAVGHRVVHGGETFTESTLIDDGVIKGIEDCIDLAPLHNPNNVKGILAARDLFGKDVPQVAVFDTSFHHSIPEQAYLYAIPYHLYRRHKIRRYGFHGTSHRYVAFRYRALRNVTREQTNIITFHLGKWLLSCGHQSWSFHRHLDGNDAAGRACHGHAVRRSRSSDRQRHCPQRGIVTIGGRHAAEHAVRVIRSFRTDE